MKQLNEYSTFNDLGKNVIPLDGYKKIKVHLIYDIKYDIRHKAWCVADRHLTEIRLDSVYSGEVSLRGLRMMISLAEWNQLDAWITDISNAYLEAKTYEKFYITQDKNLGRKKEIHCSYIKHCMVFDQVDQDGMKSSLVTYEILISLHEK